MAQLTYIDDDCDYLSVTNKNYIFDVFKDGILFQHNGYYLAFSIDDDFFRLKGWYYHPAGFEMSADCRRVIKKAHDLVKSKGSGVSIHQLYRSVFPYKDN